MPRSGAPPSSVSTRMTSSGVLARSGRHPQATRLVTVSASTLCRHSCSWNAKGHAIFIVLKAHRVLDSWRCEL